MDYQNSFKIENDELLNFILYNKFFSNFKKDANKDVSLELYITTECNQKCEYCYLVKHGDELYPKNIRNHEVIKNNLNILLNFILDKKMYLKELDIFSGEILGTKFGYEILDIILDFVKDGLKIGMIVIPTNCSFALNEENFNKIQTYFDSFDKAGTRFHLSASVDGLIIESDSRSFKSESLNSSRDQNFYDKLFKFADKNNMGFHPMVSAHAIDKWDENLEWWDRSLQKIGKSVDDIMMLEVRNNEWDTKNIISFLKFLNHCCNKLISSVGSEEYVKKAIFNYKGGYNSYRIERLDIYNRKEPTCSISKFLSVRLGDLSIVPCHRLSYDRLIYGKFKVEDNKITGIESNNIQLANKILLGSCKTSLKCDGCKFVNFCLRGCLGCQYEENNDPLIPCDTVCEMQKAKICFLIKKYARMGILEIIKNYNGEGFEKKNKFLDEVNKIMDTEDFIKWEPVINQILK